MAARSWPARLEHPGKEARSHGQEEEVKKVYRQEGKKPRTGTFGAE